MQVVEKLVNLSDYFSLVIIKTGMSFNGSEDEGGDGDGSYSSSIYSRSMSNESFANEWESFVTEDKRLFYVEFNPQTTLKIEKSENSLQAVTKNHFGRTSTRRSNKGS